MPRRPRVRPLILIGAARSGTKVCRDAMAKALGIPAVPYDVGYVWRYGDDARSDDRMLPGDVRPKTRRMVESFLSRYADADGAVIEKSVGNTLRVGYVAELVPDARFIHLVRNGVDVAESSRRQWQLPADYGYLRDKWKHFPVRMAPTYGRHYAWSLLRRRFARDRRVGTWGPRYPGIDQDLYSEPLLTVCGRQWREAVRVARHDFAALDRPVIEIRYEDLVADPVRQLTDIAELAGRRVDHSAMRAAASILVDGRTGVGARTLTDAELGLLDTEIGDVMTELGYQRPKYATPTTEASVE